MAAIRDVDGTHSNRWGWDWLREIVGGIREEGVYFMDCSAEFIERDTLLGFHHENTSQEYARAPRHR